MGIDDKKELIALVDLIVDAIHDGVSIAEGGAFAIAKLTVLQNLIPDFVPAFQAINMVPSEIKALTFQDDEAIVVHIAGKLGIANAKANAIIQAALQLASDTYNLVVAIKS